MQQEEYDYPKLWILVFCLVAFGCLPVGPKAKEDKTTGLRSQSRYMPHFCFVKLFSLEELLKLHFLANRKDEFHSMFQQLSIS